MDFFSFATVAEETYTMFFLEDNIALYLIFGGICYAVLYAFQAIGLYTIAGREGYAHRWMAFVPFLNTYYIGVCAQKNKFMGIDTKKLSLVAAIYEAVVVGFYIIFYTAWYLVQKNSGLIEGTATETLWGQQYTYPIIRLDPAFPSIHPELIWAGWCYENLRSRVITWLEIGFIFIRIAVLTCFFQTYSARHYFIFSLLSVLFPISGIFIFVVKNNRGLSYAEYTRMVQEQFYRQYRNQQNNPYNGNGGVRQDGYPPQDRPAPPEDPFPEYGNNDKPGDPFDEFKN